MNRSPKNTGAGLHARRAPRVGRAIVAALAAALLTLPAHAQSRQVPGAAPDGPVVIHSATIHTVAGDVIENGYLVFEKGVITRVGAGPVSTPRNATLRDGSGLHVYPGLISAATTVGLTETAAVDVTVDTTEYGRVKPEVRAAVAVNPDSDLIPVTRANGILTAHVIPRGGLVSGRSSVIRLDGWTWEDLAILPEAGLVVNWPRTEPINAWWMQRSAEEQRKEIAEDLAAVETLFDDALAYINARDHDETVKTDLRYEAMRPALAGTQPVFINAASMGQIESAVGWAVRRGIRPVIVGGFDADKVIPLLKKHDVPVIINGLHRLPSGRHYDYDQPFSLPAKLHAAGIRFCIASGAEAAHERNLNHIVATSAAYGLPKDEALRAVTQHAAEILGVGDRLGTLEKGKAATLIVTTGDPLEITTDTLMAFIDGRPVDLGSRHTMLYAKYREKYRQLGLIE